MSLPISRQTRQLLTRHGLRLKKSLGQNFLTDPHILAQIVDAAQLTSQTGVIEIGPGIGALTEKLLEQGNQVLAIELDQRLIPVLQEIFHDQSRFTVMHGDALQIDFAQLSERFVEAQEVAVVANLPYYITSPILLHLLTNRYPLQRIVVMIQQEVAERLVAAPNSKAYGSLSVLVQYFAQVEQVLTVPKQVFFPQPKVDSAVVRLELRREPAVQVADEALFFTVVRAAFAKRRKTLLNTLHASFAADFAKHDIVALLTAAGIDPGRRGETCSLAEFASLTAQFYQRRV
jgi:16S rRNA (adenine1518-N6/adenine1519-N6)-dimethyltransferase